MKATLVQERELAGQSYIKARTKLTITGSCFVTRPATRFGLGSTGLFQNYIGRGRKFRATKSAVLPRPVESVFGAASFGASFMARRKAPARYELQKINIAVLGRLYDFDQAFGLDYDAFVFSALLVMAFYALPDAPAYYFLISAGRLF